MKLFGHAVNIATLPVAVVKDAITVMEGDETYHTAEQIEKLKREAEEDAR